MKPDARPARSRAAVLALLAAALWWHAWMPGLILVAFLLWAVLHTRYQGTRREAFLRFRARVWPPAPLVIIAVIVGGSLVYGLSAASIEARVLPIALNGAALAVLVLTSTRAMKRAAA